MGRRILLYLVARFHIFLCLLLPLLPLLRFRWSTPTPPAATLPAASGSRALRAEVTSPLRSDPLNQGPGSSPFHPVSSVSTGTKVPRGPAISPLGPSCCLPSPFSAADGVPSAPPLRRYTGKFFAMSGFYVVYNFFKLPLTASLPELEV